jgi:ferredoxin
LSNFTVTVQPEGWTFEARPDQSVLEAALAACVPLPSSCRNGTCRTCLCRLVSGHIRYRIKWPGVSLDEKADGLILPCVACAESALTLERLHVHG